MLRTTLSVNGQDIFQSRTAALLVQIANRYESRIMIECDSKRINAKSVLGLLSLTADASKDPLVLTVEGTDEQRAHEAILAFIDTHNDKE